MMLRTPEVLMDVVSTRHEQERKVRRGGALHTAASPEVTDPERLAGLMYAMGRISEWINESPADPSLVTTEERRQDLVSVAAVAVAWAEALS